MDAPSLHNAMHARLINNTCSNVLLNFHESWWKFINCGILSMLPRDSVYLYYHFVTINVRCKLYQVIGRDFISSHFLKRTLTPFRAILLNSSGRICWLETEIIRFTPLIKSPKVFDLLGYNVPSVGTPLTETKWHKFMRSIYMDIVIVIAVVNNNVSPSNLFGRSRRCCLWTWQGNIVNSFQNACACQDASNQHYMNVISSIYISGATLLRRRVPFYS